MGWPIFGLAYLAGHLTLGALLRGNPSALAVFGNAALLLPPLLVVFIVARRRGEWKGCQWLFWMTLAAGCALWMVGHAGWAVDGALGRSVPWLHWHTVFSLTGGLAPLLALVAQPHRGPRETATASAGIDIAGLALVAGFLYAFFILAPQLTPGLDEAAQRSLLVVSQTQRLALLGGLVLAAVAARQGPWRAIYRRMAAGVAIGAAIRVVTSVAIVRGDYYVGSPLDLAWIVPFLVYAWVAAEAPASEAAGLEPVEARLHSALMLGACALVPAVGYGTRLVWPLGEPVDGLRLLLTGVALVGLLGMLIARLAVKESALRRADARVRLLAAATEHTGDLIMITGADGRLEHANRAFRRALGCESEELAGAPLETFLAPESGRLRREIMEEVEGRGLWRGTLVRRRRDGSTFPASCTVVSLRDEQGRLTHYVGVERDMTDELSRRDQLIHAERLSAVGELVAGVAHELNNPLQTIVGRAELLLAPEADPVRRADLGLIRNEAGRAGAIVRGLLSFARRGTAGRAAADLNDLVTRMVEQRRPALRAHEIEVECRCAPDLPPAQVNAEEIQQVLLNLLLNAEQALSAWPGRRRLTIETALTDGRVQVEVSDSGPGVSAALAGRVFEPFFTTREVGAGAGLGLSLSLGIATAHGGTLALVPAPTGACFRLTLPAGAYADL